jgi:RecA/RadA recombinase
MAAKKQTKLSSADDRMKRLREKATKIPGGAGIIRDNAKCFSEDRHLEILPVPNTALCYLLGIPGIPLGRAMTVVGKEGSCKSVFSHWLEAVFMLNGGFAGFVDTEKKTNFYQVHGVFRNVLGENWREIMESNFFFMDGSSQEDMISKQRFFGTQMSMMNAEGDVFPWVMNTDSINYLMQESYQKKVLEDDDQSDVGFAHMHKANKLQAWMGSCLPAFVDDYPAVFTCVNHLKEKTEQKGKFTVTKAHEAGGAFKEFAWSYKLVMKKSNHVSGVQSEKRQGITITTAKSTGSENGRKIGLTMETRQVLDEVGEFVGLDVSFSWDACLAELLCGKPKWDKEKSVTSAAFQKELGLDKSSSSYSCKYLDIDNVSAAELGRAIEHRISTDKEFKNLIYKELWIANNKPFDYSNWAAPSDAKMKVDELRRLFPVEKAPAKKRGAPPAESTTPEAPPLPS